MGKLPCPCVSKAYLDAIDPNVKVPYVLEFTIGIEHELVKDLNVGVRYINKDRKQVLGSVLWDKASGRYWYTHEQAPEWWIPFTTTVPGVGAYPAQQVTMYFLSNNAPDQNYRLTNIPEGTLRYHSLEISFDKRLANGWQLGGSVNFSKSTGNYPVSYASWASSSNFSSANSFVNRDGELPYSRPLLIKLYGTFNLPYDFMCSFFYAHADGSPWARTVTVVPPAGWAAANNVSSVSYSVNVEVPGTRRNEAADSLDLRLAKDIRIGSGKIGAYRGHFQPSRRLYADHRQEPRRHVASGGREHHQRNLYCRFDRIARFHRIPPVQVLGPLQVLDGNERLRQGAGPTALPRSVGRG